MILNFTLSNWKGEGIASYEEENYRWNEFEVRMV